MPWNKWGDLFWSTMRLWVFFRESMKAKFFCPHDEQRFGKSIRIHHGISDHCRLRHSVKGVARFWVQDLVIAGTLMIEIFLVVTRSGNGFSWKIKGCQNQLGFSGMLQTNFLGLLVWPAPKSFQVASCIDESMVGIIFLQCLCALVHGVYLGNGNEMKLNSLTSQKYSLVF